MKIKNQHGFTLNERNQGFTLIELLLGVTLSAFIFLATSSFIALLYKTNSKTQRTSVLESAKNDLQQELSTAIKWGNTIDLNNNELTIDGSTYSLKNGVIYKNSDALTSASVLIKSFAIKDISGASNIKALKLSIELANKDFPTTNDVLNLFVSQRKQAITGSEIPPEATVKPATPIPSTTASAGPTKSPTPKPSTTPSGTPKPSATLKPSPTPSPTPGR